MSVHQQLGDQRRYTASHRNKDQPLSRGCSLKPALAGLLKTFPEATGVPLNEDVGGCLCRHRSCARSECHDLQMERFCRFPGTLPQPIVLEGQGRWSEIEPLEELPLDAFGGIVGPCAENPTYDAWTTLALSPTNPKPT